MVNNKKVAAIIAEYNPFHNGHEYHIKKTREKTGADYVVILMSGNFVQRGEPAILDRYTRANLCLSHGADAVFELPVTVSTSSAEIFAHGGVALAHKLGIVDYLSFGAENENITELLSCTELLFQNKKIEQDIKTTMSNGLTYPEARDSVLRKNGYEKEASLLSSSNNILAISYLSSLLALKSPITPIAIQRTAISHDAPILNHEESFASAKAIREHLIHSKGENLGVFLPEATRKNLSTTDSFIHKDDFSDLLFAKLEEIMMYKRKKEAIKILSSFHDVTPDLASRIYNLSHIPAQYSEFAASLWSKNHTYSRIDRILFHIILGITKNVMEENKKQDYCPYIRPLAIKRTSLELLTGIKQNAQKSLPLLTRIGDIKKCTQKTAEHSFYLNQYSTALYSQIAFIHHRIKTHDDRKDSFMQIF